MPTDQRVPCTKVSAVTKAELRLVEMALRWFSSGRARWSAVCTAMVMVVGCSSDGVTNPTPTVSATTTTTTTTPAPPAPSADGSLSLNAAQWEALSDPDFMPLQNNAKGQLTFPFPSTGSINYVYSIAAPTQISGSVTASMEIVTSGPVVFDYMTEPFNTCTTPSTVRPFIWSNRTGFGEFDRWWSNPTSIELTPGSSTLTVPLTPDRWSSVYGKLGNTDATAEAAFARALRNVSQLGLTFGGGCFFGHGVRVKNGSATFTLTSYQVK